MKLFWIGLVALFPAMADAASPEQAYLASRDAHIRRLAALEKSGANIERLDKMQKPAAADLEKQIKRIVGPSKFALPGLPAEGKINSDTLLKSDQGFGLLDGLSYASKDHKTLVVVTTEGLFKAWLREHRRWWNDNNVPQDPAQALRHASFYTQALSTDAAVIRFAELPVKKPAAASLAFAMLGTRAQDVGAREADELTLALLQAGRLYVVRVKAATRLGPFPPCEQLWEQATKQSQAEFVRRQANPNVKTPDRQISIEEEADRAFRRCFAERAPRETGFADLVRQAQDIVDALPGR